ncbi:MAG: hotdog fold thioesterase [Cyclobacteriaceae bacterium]
MKPKENPYAKLLGIEIVEVGKGTAQVVSTIRPAHLNHLGYTHGGFIFSVADLAFELASNSHEVDAVGLTVSMQYHRALSPGAKVRAIARETHLGKTIATYHVDVTSGEKLIATFTGTVYRKQPG